MNTNLVYIKLNEDDEGNIHSVEWNLPYLRASKDGGHCVISPLIKALGFSNKSEDDAYRDYENDVNLFFQVHIKRRTLKTALTSLGWVRQDHHLSQ